MKNTNFWRCPHGMIGTPGAQCPECEGDNKQQIDQKIVDIKKRMKYTLIVDPWNTTCGNCGRGADPDDKTHDRVYGYSVQPGEKGCGIKWKYITSHYANSEKKNKAMRPDLKFTGDVPL